MCLVTLAVPTLPQPLSDLAPRLAPGASRLRRAPLDSPSSAGIFPAVKGLIRDVPDIQYFKYPAEYPIQQTAQRQYAPAVRSQLWLGWISNRPGISGRPNTEKGRTSDSSRVSYIYYCFMIQHAFHRKFFFRIKNHN